MLLSDQVGPAALGLDRAPLAALGPMRAVFVLSAARLLDEPTASLDARHRVELLGLLRRLAAQGFAVLVVLHDLNEAAFVADRVAVLAETRLAALGATREVPWPVLLEQAFGVAFRDLDGVLAPAFAA